jgi:hypothetical protein
MMMSDTFLKDAATPEQYWRILQHRSEILVGVKLFTVMTVDMEKLLARRVYTNNPTSYPCSGTKPITLDVWFDVVHRQQRIFVANTIAEIAKVFPDHEKIWSLGCGSVVNLPVIVEGELVATVNLLHEEHYYTPERVHLISSELSEPSRLAYSRTRALDPLIN